MNHKSQSQAEKLELLGEAIGERRVIEVTYNGNTLRLEPYQVFVRNNALYLAGFNPEKSRRHNEEMTLGGYNLAGLSHMSVTDQSFEPVSTFEDAGIRPNDHVLLSVNSGVAD